MSDTKAVPQTPQQARNLAYDMMYSACVRALFDTGRAGANADTSHPLREAWEACRDAMRAFDAAALSAAEGAPGQYFSEPPAKPEVREPAGYFRNAAATGEKPHYVQVDGHYTGAADIYPLYHARPQALEEVLPVSKDEQRLLFSEWYRQHTGDDPTLKNVRWFAFTKTAAVAFAAWLAAPTQAKAAEPSEQGGTK